jgi:glycosyltransferase involved in cell wall biosynthesis
MNPLLFIGTSSMDRNATQQKLYFLSCELARRGRTIAACVPDLPQNREFFNENGKDVDVRYFPKGSAFEEHRWKSALLLRERWHAVHSIGVGYRTLVSFKHNVGGAPVLFDFDEQASSIQGNPLWKRLYFLWIERQMFANAAGFTCSSAYLMNWVGARRPDLNDRTLYLPVAIAREEHRIDPELSVSIRSRFLGRKILIYLGSISKTYQVGDLIELAEALSRIRHDFIVMICGDGPDRAFYHQQVIERNLSQWVHFEGHVDRRKVASFLDAASVLLFPFHDTLQNRARCPTKAYHYAAANRPLVTNRIGEVAALFGEKAFYFQEKDISAMAESCQQAMSATHSFSNEIPFASLTWSDRANRYEKWAFERGISQGPTAS